MAYVAPTTVSTGDVLTASRYNADVVENVSQLYASQKRLSVQTTSTFVNSGANLGAAAEVFTDLTYTAAGSTTYRVEVWLPYVSTATNAGANLQIHLTDGGSNSISFLGYVGSGDGTRGAIQPVYAVYYDTPSAGTRTLNVRAVHGTAAGNVGASTGENMTAFIRVFGPDIT